MAFIYTRYYDSETVSVQLILERGKLIPPTYAGEVKSEPMKICNVQNDTESTFFFFNINETSQFWRGEPVWEQGGHNVEFAGNHFHHSAPLKVFVLNAWIPKLPILVLIC